MFKLMGLKQGWFFLLLCGVLFWPQLGFGFSESELESLAESGSKSVTKSSWRRTFSLSLSRNLDFKTGHLSLLENRPDKPNTSSWCNPQNADSLCDLHSLYYRSQLSLYYSLNTLGQKLKAPDFLKKTELFISAGFRSNFAGGDYTHLAPQEQPNYIEGGIRDITGGWTTPIYQKDKLFSFFDFSALLLPLSIESKEIGLKSSFVGTVEFLYFIKKKDKQKWMLESSHNLNYNDFTKPTIDKTGDAGYNMPLTTTQGINLIWTQKFHTFLPANNKLFAYYTFGLNLHQPKCNEEGDRSRLFRCGGREHYLQLGALSSWKVKKNFFISLVAQWKNLVQISNPNDENVSVAEPWSLAFHHWYLSLTGSYTF